MAIKKLSKRDSTIEIKQNNVILDEDDFIISKTDINGNILYCNEMFSKISGYDASDLIGANHNLIRHPDMPKLAFKILWDLIKEKKEFFGFVKNLIKDGSYYWVFAYITPDFDNNGNIISYTSVRRKATQSAIDTIIPIYKLLIDAEKSGGVEASFKVLNNYLKEHNTSYDEFIINLQKGAIV